MRTMICVRLAIEGIISLILAIRKPQRRPGLGARSNRRRDRTMRIPRAQKGLPLAEETLPGLVP